MATTKVTVTDDGRVTVTTPDRVYRNLDPDQVETAWLLRLEHTDRVALAVALRDEHGFVGDSIRYALAADALHRANISL